ncbi:MAG: alginate lyase family protein [Deltaproteobacteria bacterium]|nr:alginate lyase family protein [Deltaproteobacteria bacterium]
MATLSPLTPRSIFCVTDHAYRDRAVADEVRTGRFTHVGMTCDLGVEPDWLSVDLPEDKEWRIEWSKFYYGLNLGHAFRETGDPTYLQTWERLVWSWMKQVPPDHDRSDVIGRRLQNWVYAWNVFAAAPAFPGLTAGLTDQLLTSISDQVWHLRAHLTPERNHRTLELYALFITAVALPNLKEAPALLDFAIAELHGNLLTDVLSDGVHRESSTHYHLIALRTYLAARENARRFDLHFPPGYDAHLTRACEFALHCHRPDGAIPALSDSDTGSYTDLLALAATLLSRPDFLYVATAGEDGTPPTRRYVSFPQGGYFTQRSGWGTRTTPFRQERFLIFDCGPLGDGGHGHYDLLNVEIAAGGRPLVVDPGRYTYSDADGNWRRWFKGTAAHNTVCVDGLDQTPYQRGKPKGPLAQGRLLRRASAPGFDLLEGEATSPAYDAIHQRHVAFIGDEYWVIADHLHANQPHRYDLRFHLTPDAWERTTIDEQEQTVIVRAPGLTLVFPAIGGVTIEPGWVAPQYGTKLPAPVVSIAVDNSVDMDFFTLVFPCAEQDPVPTFDARQDTSSPTHPVTFVEVRGVGPQQAYRDIIAWSPTATRLTLGPLHCHATAGWLRESLAGKSVSFRLCDATHLKWTSRARSLVWTSARPQRSIWWHDTTGLIEGKEEPLQ